MNKPAFIVDGHQEQKIVQKLCPGSAVRMLNCNGQDVELQAAAKRIASLIRLMGNRYFPFIIVFDREERRETAEQVKALLEKSIRDEGVNDQLVFGIPDRMIENWILADWANCQTKGCLKNRLKSECAFEGRNGKSDIRKFLPRDGRYQETIEGVDWFVTADPNTIAQYSCSFREFLVGISRLRCKWLRV